MSWREALAAALKGVSAGGPAPLEERELLILLAARLALGAGCKTGLVPDGENARIFIELPAGQVSWSLPAELFEGLWPAYSGKQEVIGRAERLARIRLFIQ